MSIWHVVYFTQNFTINVSIIYIIIQYFFVLNKFSVIYLLQASKQICCGPRKRKGAVPRYRHIYTHF